jgi:hypothetical protein
VGEEAVGVYQLTPLRRIDVRREAENRGIPADAFLSRVIQLGAGPLASRLIALSFLLGSFARGGRFPLRSTDLYFEGCGVLSDESRERPGRERRLSAGQRFAVAGRVAPVMVFCDRAAIHTGPRHENTPVEDIRSDELLGQPEFFGGEKINVSPRAMKEICNTGLFRSVGHPDLADVGNLYFFLNRIAGASSDCQAYDFETIDSVLRDVIAMMRQADNWEILESQINRRPWRIAETAEQKMNEETPPR